MEPKALQPTKKWYKTKGGITTIVVLAIIGFIIGAFVLTTGYYLWIAAYGDADQKQTLQDRFGQSFTTSNGAAALGAKSEIDVDVASLVREYNPSFGLEDAPVTVLAFIDFECPFCRQSFSTFEKIRQRYAPAVRIVFKQSPLESIHPHSGNAAKAAQCAHEQDAFWNYYKKLFERQELGEDALLTYAQELQLDTTAFQICMASSAVTQQINQDLQDGITVEVRGTPTYIINNIKLEGATAEQEWNSTIVEALQNI